jgi:hypothetical protein
MSKEIVPNATAGRLRTVHEIISFIGRMERVNINELSLDGF